MNQILNLNPSNILNLTSKLAVLESLDKPKEDFLFRNIGEWENSSILNTMLLAQRAYRNKSKGIDDKQRWYINRKGVKEVAKNLVNTKLFHPFFNHLTTQKTDYIFSKEPSISTENKALMAQLETYLDSKFYNTILNLATHAIINGIAWLQVYYNEKGQLSYKRIPSEEVIPFWQDTDHLILDAIIRRYTIKHYKADGTTEDIVKIEYYTNEGVWYYQMTDKGLIEDFDDGDSFRGHFNINLEKINTETGEKETENTSAIWDKIPFIPFKYNALEMSLLEFLDTLVDDYDINTSNNSDMLQETQDNIKVVKNYEGTDKEEFSRNLNTFRTAFLRGDGDLFNLHTPIQSQALEAHLNRLRRDIYEAGKGVDTQEIASGNYSGIALKFKFSNLDSDCNKLANQFKVALDEFFWFVKVDLLNRGLGDFMNETISIIFNSDGIINESEVIADINASVGILSERTLLSNHPYIIDVDSELKQIKKEREEKAQEYQSLLDTPPNFHTHEEEKYKVGDE